jgi:hypothetical protein
MEIGSTAPKNMGGTATFILINDDVCSTVASTTPTTVPVATTQPPTTLPPVENTVPPVTMVNTVVTVDIDASSVSVQGISETRTPSTFPVTGPLNAPVGLAGLSVLLVALMFIAIARHLDNRSTNRTLDS